MLSKLNELSIAAYLTVTSFLQDFKKDERGLSDAVTAVLLILVAVLAVVMIWNFLGEWIGDMWAKIIGKSNGIGG